MMARRTMSIMGDGGFWHNGFLSGVSSALLNGGDAILLIMKNGYTSATGTQELLSSPLPNRRSTPRASRARPRPIGTIENTLKGAGVKWLRTVHTYRVSEMAKTLKEAFTTPEPGLEGDRRRRRVPARAPAAYPAAAWRRALKSR